MRRLHHAKLLAPIVALAAMLLVLGAAHGSRASVQPATAQPNILFILTDDLDAKSMEMFPRLTAQLADQGTSFSSYFVNVSLCCPSRTSTLRGQYSHNTRITGNQPPSGGFQMVHELGLEDSTVATWLQGSGYHTALLGKYLNGYPGGVAATYVPPGWDDWYSPAAGNPYSEFNYRLNENGTLVRYGNAPGDYETDVLAGKADGIIRRSATEGKPFFMYLAVYAPHAPSTPAPRYADTFADVPPHRPASFNEEDVSDKPAWVRARPPLTERQIAQIDRQYRRRLQSMLAVEDMVDKLIETLRATGQLDNTYIFFSSDNGFHLGEHRLPMGKQTAYEEDVRVPLIVRGPGVPAGRTLDHLTGNIDLAPTWTELAGVQPPDFVDGRSLVPLLRPDASPVSAWRQAFLLEHGAVDPGTPGPARRRARGGQGTLEPPDPDQVAAAPARRVQAIPTLQALRTTDFTYVAYVTGETELYDLHTDPDQLQNLAASADPALLARLAAWLNSVGPCAGAGCRTAEAGPPGP